MKNLYWLKNEQIFFFKLEEKLEHPNIFFHATSDDGHHN